MLLLLLLAAAQFRLDGEWRVGVRLEVVASGVGMRVMMVVAQQPVRWRLRSAGDDARGARVLFALAVVTVRWRLLAEATVNLGI